MNRSETISGLQLVDQYYAAYGSRAAVLKAQGQRLVGYLCAYVPLEIISAAGLIPFRIRGSVSDPVTLANARMETIVCPVVRSCFDMALKGKFGFIEGLIIPHSCDSMCLTHDVWRASLNLGYFHLLNIPHSLEGGAPDFFTESIRTFKTSLERFTGHRISDESIADEIENYNRYRASVRDLYQLRAQDSGVSGSRIVRTLVAGMSLPVTEADSLVRSVTDEIKGLSASPADRRPRIMISGSEQDDDSFCRVVEECGGNVVTDFLCPGLREYGTDVATDSNPLAAIAKRYLNLYCARSYRDHPGSHEDRLEARFGPIGQLVKDFRVAGVIVRVHRCCDPYGLEVSALQDYLAQFDVQVLYLEDDYSQRDTERLRTRIQAFIEMLQQSRNRIGTHD